MSRFDEEVLHNGDPSGADESEFDTKQPDYGDDVSLGYDDPELASHNVEDDMGLDGSSYSDNDRLDGFDPDDDEYY